MNGRLQKIFMLQFVKQLESRSRIVLRVLAFLIIAAVGWPLSSSAASVLRHLADPALLPTLYLLIERNEETAAAGHLPPAHPDKIPNG
jgi:hypothetical protein